MYENQGNLSDIKMPNPLYYKRLTLSTSESITSFYTFQRKNRVLFFKSSLSFQRGFTPPITKVFLHLIITLSLLFHKRSIRVNRQKMKQKGLGHKRLNIECRSHLPNYAPGIAFLCSRYRKVLFYLKHFLVTII